MTRKNPVPTISRIVAGAALAVSVLSGCYDNSQEGDGPPPLPFSPTIGAITVSGNHVFRDGTMWIPHAVQLVAFVAPPAAQTGAFLDAYAHFSTAELQAIKTWGADSVRMQLSQPGADPMNSERYDAGFVQQYVNAVKAARAIGLNVIVSIQDETQSGETATPATLPDAATNRVWEALAPMLNGDNGIIYEMMNEPELPVSTPDWQQWQVAMNNVIQTIRATGATNTLLADGLNYAESLDGVIPLSDPLNSVFYATHPYFHKSEDQTMAVWMSRFGAAAATFPVIVGEWTTATTYYCDSNTPLAALQFLQYLESLQIGLVAVTYDFGLPQYGGIVSDYNGTPTTFANGIQCGATGFGPGTLIQNWYVTGSVPDELK